MCPALVDKVPRLLRHMRFLFSFLFSVVHIVLFFFFCTVLCSRRVPHTTYIRRVNKKRKILFCLMVSLCLFHTFSLNFFRLPDLNGSRTEKLSYQTHTHLYSSRLSKKNTFVHFEMHFFSKYSYIVNTLVHLRNWTVGSLKKLGHFIVKKSIVFFSSRCDWAKHELLRVHHFILKKKFNC